MVTIRCLLDKAYVLSESFMQSSVKMKSVLILAFFAAASRCASQKKVEIAFGVDLEDDKLYYRTRHLMPSSKSEFLALCENTLMSYRRLYRDQFSEQIFSWVSDEVVQIKEWDSTKLISLQGSTRHFPDFNSLPENVTSSFIDETCPYYHPDIKSKNSGTNKRFCRSPINYDRCPVALYMPITGEVMVVARVCSQIYDSWNEIFESCAASWERQGLLIRSNDVGEKCVILSAF